MALTARIPDQFSIALSDVQMEAANATDGVVALTSLCGDPTHLTPAASGTIIGELVDHEGRIVDLEGGG